MEGSKEYGNAERAKLGLKPLKKYIVRAGQWVTSPNI